MTRNWITLLIFAALFGLYSSFSAVPDAGFGKRKSEVEGALKEVLRAAEHGDAEAQYLAGALFDSQVPKPEEIERVVSSLLLKSLVSDRADYTERTETIRMESLKWYRKSAEQKHVEAQFRAGQTLLLLKHAGAQFEKIKWLTKASEQNHAEAQFWLAQLYLDSADDKDHEEGQKWLLRAAESGNPRAQYKLGTRLLDDQKGFEADYEHAVKWFAKAADQDDAEAQSFLAWCHINGRGVPKDFSQGFKWAERGAVQGDTNSQRLLGLLYRFGNGVPQDFAEAAKWLRKASQKGYDAAQYQLGELYLEGRGVEKDVAQAVRWLRKAATQGEPSAQLKLGLLYYRGDGVTQDFVSSYVWLNLAVAQGLENARGLRDALLGRMSQSQIAEGQKRASQFEPKRELFALNSIALSFTDPNSEEYQARVKREAREAKKFEARFNAFVTKLRKR